MHYLILGNAIIMVGHIIYYYLCMLPDSQWLNSLQMISNIKKNQETNNKRNKRKPEMAE